MRLLRLLDLRTRLFLLLMVPMVIVIGGYGLARIRREEAQLLEEEQRRMAVTAKALQVAVENALRDRQISDIKRLLGELVLFQDEIDRIRIFDQQLRLLLVSNPLAVAEDIPRDELERVMAWQEPVLFFRPAPDRASAAGPRVLLTFVPLRDRAGKVRGAMEIVRLAATIDTKLAAARREFWVSIGLLTTVLGILVWIAVRQSVLRPIRQLMAGVHALATGRPEPIDAEGRDEFARLARAFNEMADRLAEAHRRLVAETEARLDLARQVRQAEQLAVAGRLASELAHEIGTPLNVISGRAEYVQRELPPGSRVAGQLDIIVKQIDRISGIIASLLDVVRPAKAEIQPIALGPLLRGVVELLRPSAARQGLTLHAELAGSVRVLGDPNQLQQVAINLLVNAIEATPRGGHVVLRAREEGADGAELEVRDSGTGIAPEHVQRVFDPFFTTKPPGRGTGLGLAICRDIVREHGGTITVDSVLGTGTVVRVRLPVPADEATA